MRSVIRGYDNEEEKTHILKVAMAILFLALFALACNLPLEVFSDKDDGAQATFIAQTVNAGSSSGREEVSTETPDGPPPASATPEPQSTLTRTVAPSQVHVSGDTNCRTGPADVYEIRGAVMAGEKVEVEAVSPSGSYWYVKNPDDPGARCWIWGRYATPEGPMDNLPVFTPRPTPTPQVMVQASYLQTTGFSSLFMEFEINNTGRAPLESISVEVLDKNTGETIPARVRDDFGKIKGEGAASGSIDTLQPGKKGFAYSDFFPFAQTGAAGHQMEATIKVCTQDGLSGRCGTRTISFKSQ